MLRVWETLTGDEWSSLHVERVGKFDMPESGGSQINILEVHHVGRKRYILATDAGGKIFVFRENGTVYGTATPSRRPIAFLKQRLLFLTETGAGSLDLRTMKLKESECEGFNSSSAKNYVFDATDRSKAYGFTLQGELIQTLLLGDIMNFKCRVRSKRKLDIDKPMALHAIKGYLLIANREKVVVYNVSSQHYVRSGGVRLVFSAGLDEIIGSFLHQQASDVEDEKRMQTPLIASDYEKLVIVSLGNGYVAMYRSKLPVFKNEFNSILWTSPVLFFILFLFGAWHFFANKKEVLTSWGPDDPFSSASVTGGAPLGSGSGDRSFMDTSRTSDIMDLRGSGLRGPSRYVSPPRFPGGTANSYRPGPDTDSRPAPVDPRFRATSELKFRGSNVESAGIPKRRESLFGNSQVVDDSN
ncbi:UNVERIFIED_CONTAM: putative membrane protein [Sesamum radiatum]|uniref:Membrane protein n=1 Tax=Sesamum radiatum TaxID=300843 RepID=A0AAW2WL02_SESRA